MYRMIRFYSNHFSIYVLFSLSFLIFFLHQSCFSCFLTFFNRMLHQVTLLNVIQKTCKTVNFISGE
jgi:hypothetical protein